MTYHVYHDFIIKRIMNAVQIIQNYVSICQNANFSNDTKKPLKSRGNRANSGKTWQRKVRKNYVKSIIHLPRQDKETTRNSRINWAKWGRFWWS